MGDGKNVKGVLRDATIAAATFVSTNGPAAQAAIAAADISDPVKDSAIVAIENAETALTKAAGGIKAGEAAAGASPVPEPEAAEHSDPPEPKDLATGWAEESDSSWTEDSAGGWDDQPDGDWLAEADDGWTEAAEPSEASSDGGEGVR